MESKKSVFLLADDNEHDVVLFQKGLSKLAPSYSFYNVVNEDQVLDFIRHYKPDVLFLNMDIAGSRTLAFFQMLKDQPECKKLPVVIYTTPKSSREVKEYYSLGAVRYFVKPISYSAVLFGLEIILFLYKNNQLIVPDFEQFLINTNYKYFSY